MLFKLKTILYPWSFPTDIMHLFFENVAPQMFAHWTGKYFKGASFNDDYELSKSQWESIGTQMEKIKKDMPVKIGRPSRDIFKHHNGYKAVEWRNWIILFSLPLFIVLIYIYFTYLLLCFFTNSVGVFSFWRSVTSAVLEIPKSKIYFLLNRHLQGWSNFVRAVKLCLEPEISEEQIDDVQKLLKRFLDYYER